MPPVVMRRSSHSVESMSNILTTSSHPPLDWYLFQRQLIDIVHTTEQSLPLGTSWIQTEDNIIWCVEFSQKQGSLRIHNIHATISRHDQQSTFSNSYPVQPTSFDLMHQSRTLEWTTTIIIQSPNSSLATQRITLITAKWLLMNIALMLQIAASVTQSTPSRPCQQVPTTSMLY